MSRRKSSSLAGKLTLSAKMIAGAALYGQPIKLTHFTADTLTAARTPLVTTLNAYTAARNARKDAYQAIADAVVPIDEFITKLVDALKPRLGRRWSAAWAQLGFYRSLALPRSNSGRWNVLQAAGPFLTAHPECENADLGITHQAAATLLQSLTTVSNNLGVCLADVRSKLNARNTALKALEEEMGGMADELSQVLEEDDPRWRAFGLNIPADKQVPEAVTGLVVEPSDPEALSVNWEESMRAVRYQVEILVVGKDVAFHRVATVYDPSAELTELDAGATVKVRVIAANAGGSSAPSAEVSATVPMLLAKAA